MLDWFLVIESARVLSDVDSLTSSLTNKALELNVISRGIDLELAELREKIRQTRAHVNSVSTHMYLYYEYICTLLVAQSWKHRNLY